MCIEVEVDEHGSGHALEVDVHGSGCAWKWMCMEVDMH